MAGRGRSPTVQLVISLYEVWLVEWTPSPHTQNTVSPPAVIPELSHIWYYRDEKLACLGKLGQSFSLLVNVKTFYKFIKKDNDYFIFWKAELIYTMLHVKINSINLKRHKLFNFKQLLREQSSATKLYSFNLKL